MATGRIDLAEKVDRGEPKAMIIRDLTPEQLKNLSDATVVLLLGQDVSEAVDEDDQTLRILLWVQALRKSCAL